MPDRNAGRSLRVTVRGRFTDLSADQRAVMLAEGADHEELSARFTRDGHLTYDLSSRPFFAFRHLAVADDGASYDEAVEAAVAGAQERAAAWLQRRGLTHVLLSTRVEDPSRAPVGAKQRRLSARGR